MNDTETKPGPNHAGGDDGSASRKPEQSGVSDDDQCSDTSRSAENKRQPREIGGRKGPDPVRYGDWEKNGRCIDF